MAPSVSDRQTLSLTRYPLTFLVTSAVTALPHKVKQGMLQSFDALTRRF